MQGIIYLLDQAGTALAKAAEENARLTAENEALNEQLEQQKDAIS